MEIIRDIFNAAKVIQLDSHNGNRGKMTVITSADAFKTLGIPFDQKETRIYTIEKKGTFFGIHYRDIEAPMAKVVTVIQGKGMDYLIDLRKNSPTYLKWESLELSPENGRAVYIPAGIGHGFISLEKDTMQLFEIDASGKDGLSKRLNYMDPRIGLKLATEVTEISDYDKVAPYLE